MNTNGILHLSVNAQGRLSLWDTTGEAVAGKKDGEIVVQISLTKAQMALVFKAEGLARDKAGLNRGPAPGVVCKKGHSHNSIVAAGACDADNL